MYTLYNHSENVKIHRQNSNSNKTMAGDYTQRLNSPSFFLSLSPTSVGHYACHLEL